MRCFGVVIVLLVSVVATSVAAFVVSPTTTTTLVNHSSKKVMMSRHYNHMLLCTTATQQQEQQGQQQETEMMEGLLLRKAIKELSAQLEAAEHQVQLKKKAQKDAQTDQLIAQLFVASSSESTRGPGLVDGLRAQCLGMDTMEQIVDRLEEREVLALGQDHELERLEGMIEDLIVAVQILDEEQFMVVESNQKKNELLHP
jgi:hypothetical protein